MILIKNRHKIFLMFVSSFFFGKYDTYKGSTLNFLTFNKQIVCIGKYDTYKGSTHREASFFPPVIRGKYDTYKGSTLVLPIGENISCFTVGNMILIKDRHPNFSNISFAVILGTMILIKDG